MLAVLIYNVVIVNNNHPNHKCHPANKVDVGQPLGQAGYSLLKILPHIYPKGEHKIGSMLLYNAFCLHNSTVNATLKHLHSPYPSQFSRLPEVFRKFFCANRPCIGFGFPFRGRKGLAVCTSSLNRQAQFSRLPEPFRKFLKVLKIIVIYFAKK